MTAADSAPKYYKVSVVVPMHNEAGAVARLLAEIDAALAARGPFEIVVVDDGSRDRTPDELLAAQKQHSHLRIVRHETNCGQSQALISGVVAAQSPWIVTLDGDGQNDPADIAKLFSARDAALSPANTLFIGHRTARGEDGKALASKLANAVRAFVLGDATPDSGCGLKLFHRDVFLALPRFDALHRFMPALVIRAGGQVVSVPVSQRPRSYGRSHYGIIGRGLLGLVDLLGVWWLMRRSTRPKIIPPG
ncbi:MAG: glycosyltransferase family 2 protein [Rhodospirillaceae bacterium]|nr:glycosyltransferase family 2 protein [Rhodospirillaceae bacterium]